MRTILFLILRHAGASLSKFHSYHHIGCDMRWGASEPVLLDWYWRLLEEQWWNMWWGCWQWCDPLCGNDYQSTDSILVQVASLSLNFSPLDCPYVLRISVQQAVTPLFIDYLPIHKNRDFVFSYFCYALQCGFLNILRRLHFRQWQCLKWST
jgi:hypothetical protein